MTVIQNCIEFASSRRCSAKTRSKCADLLRDVRLAGGWVRYFLQPHY